MTNPSFAQRLDALGLVTDLGTGKKAQVLRWLDYMQDYAIEQARPEVSRIRNQHYDETWRYHDLLVKPCVQMIEGRVALELSDQQVPDLAPSVALSATQTACLGYAALHGPQWAKEVGMRMGMPARAVDSFWQNRGKIIKSCCVRLLLDRNDAAFDVRAVDQVLHLAQQRPELREALRSPIEQFALWTITESLLNPDMPAVLHISGVLAVLCLPEQGSARQQASAFIQTWAPLLGAASLGGSLRANLPREQAVASYRQVFTCIARHPCMQQTYPHETDALLDLLKACHPVWPDYIRDLLQPWPDHLQQLQTQSQQLARAPSLTSLYEQALTHPVEAPSGPPVRPRR